MVVAKETGAGVTATDISAAALDVARANALNEGVQVDFVLGDMWSAVSGEFDVIASNPPYIPTADIVALESKVKDFEPMLALDGGEDGLKFYRVIADGLDAHLKENGVLIMELGIGQAESIKQIFAEYDVQIVKDIEGVERIALVTKR